MSRIDIPIPSPPYHFLSIRSGVKERDEAFFKKAPFLLENFIAAHDAGQSVIYRVGYETAIEEIAQAFYKNPSCSEALALLPRLESYQLYEKILKKGERDYAKVIC